MVFSNSLASPRSEILVLLHVPFEVLSLIFVALQHVNASSVLHSLTVSRSSNRKLQIPLRSTTRLDYIPSERHM